MEPVTGLQALATIKPLTDLARQITDANNVEKLRALAGEALEHAINARAQTALLQDERNAAVMKLAALEAEIEDTKAFDDKAKNYTRERTSTGATIYREKQSSGAQGDSPYFCPNCFGQKKLSILNPAKGANTRIGVFDHSCSRCDATMPLPCLRATPTRTFPSVVEGANFDPFTGQ